jgi:integrase
MWVEGEYFYQGFFYWGELIGLFSGMRPGETSQLRCRDIMPLHGRPHIRFALLSVEEEEKAQHAAVSGGNDGKTDSAYRWVSLHRILLRLGIVERRDAIVADYIARKIKEVGERQRLSDEQFAQIEKEAGEQWLFPDWPVYVKKTGEIKWAHALGKACRYAFIKLKMERSGLTQYSARHFFKGLIDEVRGLAERSRKVILGHSTDGDVTTKYGPKLLTEEESLLVHRLSNRHIRSMARVLIRSKRKAERGELKVIDAWRNDMRSGDEKFQEALARRQELYR